jgi:hypothetical protein
VTKIADYLEDLSIDHLLRNQAHSPTANVYLALYTTATTDAGGGTEATGGSYAPQATTFSAAASGATSNSAAVSFTNMPAATVTHAAIVDADSGGNFLFHGPLTASKTTTAGQTLTFNIGEIDVGFTAGSAFTTYSRNVIIDRFLRNQSFTPPATVYLALYTSATDISGGGTESTGGSYARQALELDAATGGETSNTNLETFSSMPASTVTHAAILDASSGGNMMVQGALLSSEALGAGDNALFDPGEVLFTVD